MENQNSPMKSNFIRFEVRQFQDFVENIMHQQLEREVNVSKDMAHEHSDAHSPEINGKEN
jgi:hypothetical protein